MAVTFENRPIKAITDSNGDVYLNSYYNASGGELPTEYDLSNNLFPINKRDTAYNVVSISPLGGRSLVEFSGGDYTSIEGDDKFNVNAWVSITADGKTFIGQVVSYEGSPDVLLSIPYDTFFASASTITFNWYAKDYKVLVNVYVGLNPSHVSYSSQPNEFIAQKNVSAFFYDSVADKNLDSFDITGLIKNKITQSYRDITETELNLNQYTQFRVEYAEVYKKVNSSGQNELFDGTDFERDWQLGQPSFTADDFNCSAAALINEEFTTDLSDWTNSPTGLLLKDWVWNTAAAQTVLDASGSGRGSRQLYQDYAYTAGARYNIESSIDVTLPCRFQVWIESAVGTSKKIHDEILPIGTTVVNFDFQADQISGFPPEDPTRIQFQAINIDTSGTNTVRVDYFEQSQADEGCLPYLSSVYAVRQFRSPFGGSMGDYEYTLDVLGRFLTNNTNLIVKPTSINPEISLLANNQTATNNNIGLKSNVTFSDGVTKVFYSSIASSGEGVYRLSLNNIQSSIINYITLNSVRVINASIEGVVSGINILIDWDNGTFETSTGITQINPDSLGSAALNDQDSSNPRTGTYSGSAQAPVAGIVPLGGGGRTLDTIFFQAGITYNIEAYVMYEQTGSFSYVDDVNQDTFISLAIMDGSTLINTNVEYQQIKGNIEEYTLLTASYTPSTDGDYSIGFYKGGIDASVGAQKIYIDDVSVRSDERSITNSINLTYDNSNKNCNTYSLKWLNSLGGIDYHTFEGRSTHNRDITENNRYKKQVFGNWDSNFVGGEGIGFEQYIKSNKVQTLRTKIINQDLKRYLSEIKTSLNVKLYLDDIGDYITVLVDKDSFNIYNDSVNTYRFEFDVILPDEYVQTA